MSAAHIKGLAFARVTPLPRNMVAIQDVAGRSRKQDPALDGIALIFEATLRLPERRDCGPHHRCNCRQGGIGGVRPDHLRLDERQKVGVDQLSIRGQHAVRSRRHIAKPKTMSTASAMSYRNPW